MVDFAKTVVQTFHDLISLYEATRFNRTLFCFPLPREVKADDMKSYTIPSLLNSVYVIQPYMALWSRLCVVILFPLL